MRATAIFEVIYGVSRERRGFDLLGMLADWKFENPSGSRDEFLEWVNARAFDMFNEEFDPWTSNDLSVKEVDMVGPLDITYTEWTVLQQVEGQMNIFEDSDA